MKVLIVEDDRDLSMQIKRGLVSIGFDVIQAFDGEDGFYQLCEGSCDIAIVDRMLPVMSGTEVISRIRKMGKDIPIIIATALGDVDDRINGLDSGADDYIVKPFDVRELAARIRALTRRAAGGSGNQLSFGDVIFSKDELKINGPLGDQAVTPTEAELIETLMRNSDKVITRNQLFVRVWGIDSDSLDGSLDIYIHYARNHLAKISQRTTIRTVRGKGYRLEFEQ
ncbi:MAG: response regulator transcription factor [Oscillospiraceae bacterium]|nr:response regulator transcription factor [Oscillospiraceae bacterium]